MLQKNGLKNLRTNNTPNKSYRDQSCFNSHWASAHVNIMAKQKDYLR